MATEFILEETLLDALFIKSGVIPLTPLRDSASPESLKLYFAWLDRLNQTFSLGRTPWLPIGHVGPVLIICHERPDAPCPFPPWVAQRAVVRQSSYRAIGAQLASVMDRRNKWDHPLPTSSIPLARPLSPTTAAHDAVTYILENLVVTDLEHHKLTALAKNPAIQSADMPDGTAEAIEFLCGRAKLIDIRNASFAKEANGAIIEQARNQFQISIFFATEKCAYLATPKVPNHQAKDVVTTMLSAAGIRREVHLVLAPISAIRETISARASMESAAELHRQIASTRAAINSGMIDQSKSDIVIDEDRIRGLKLIPNETPNEDYFHSILYSAIKAGASDIHFEQFNGNGRIRLRKDGDCILINTHPIEVSRGLLGFAKSGGVSGLATNNHEPQDARASVRIGKDIFNLRISLIPHRMDTHQVMVIRILPKKSDLLNLDKLQLSDRQVRLLRRASGRPNGLILMTGPTGSGKTTTLYAMLTEINRPDVKINTIEDPIEVDLEGATQSQINEAQSVRFGDLMPAILRQDPDIILIGEIRDKESAEAALSMAETGHLVCSSLHTNSEVEAVTRMMSIIQDPSRRTVLAKALILIVAQRLVPRLCPDCRVERVPTPADAARYTCRKMPVPQRIWDNFPKGCCLCREGYRGRTSIMSLLPVTGKVSDFIMKGRDTNEILEAARDTGFKTLFEEALDKVARGDITIRAADDWSDPWENFDFRDGDGESREAPAAASASGTLPALSA